MCTDGVLFYSKGLHCVQKKFIVSRDVILKETSFPFAEQKEQEHLLLFFPPSDNGVYDEDNSMIEDCVDHHITPTDQVEPDTSANPPSNVVHDDPPSIVFPDTITGAHRARQSSRSTKPPIWLQDFVTTTIGSNHPYSMSKYVQYQYLSHHYQAFLGNFSAEVELSKYEEAIKDPRWVAAMQ